MNLPTVMIVSAALKVDADAVIEAQGRGPGAFGTPLTTDDPSTANSPITHYALCDLGVPEEVVAQWNAMTAGNLPALGEGKVWGENGVISAQGALAVGAVISVCSGANYEPADLIAAALAAKGLREFPPIEL